MFIKTKNKGTILLALNQFGDVFRVFHTFIHVEVVFYKNPYDGYR